MAFFGFPVSGLCTLRAQILNKNQEQHGRGTRTPSPSEGVSGASSVQGLCACFYTVYLYSGTICVSSYSIARWVEVALPYFNAGILHRDRVCSMWNEKNQDLEIFKRDWKLQASHPPNPYFLWGFLEVGLENFKRDWIFFNLWALRVAGRGGCKATNLSPFFDLVCGDNSWKIFGAVLLRLFFRNNLTRLKITSEGLNNLRSYS